MKAILKNGAIYPKEPVPSDWSEGTELDVQKSTNGAPDLEMNYRRLRSQWYSETRVLSDPAKIMGHPAMRAILAMGEEVVPIILHDLQAQPSLMVWALPKIVGANPPFQGNNDKMIEAWLQWGREKGLL
jgi:hypothetical protein